jgi:hypothetical protein
MIRGWPEIYIQAQPTDEELADSEWDPVSASRSPLASLG